MDTTHGDRDTHVGKATDNDDRTDRRSGAKSARAEREPGTTSTTGKGPTTTGKREAAKTTKKQAARR